MRNKKARVISLSQYKARQKRIVIRPKPLKEAEVDALLRGALQLISEAKKVNEG